MALTLSRIDKRTKAYTITAATFGVDPATITGMSAALLPPRTGSPNASTVWTSVTYTAGMATVTWAGPDANPSGAIVVASSADVWLKAVDANVQAVRIERITLLGDDGTGVPYVAPTVLDSLVAGLLNNQTSQTRAAALGLPTYPT